MFRLSFILSIILSIIWLTCTNVTRCNADISHVADRIIALSTGVDSASSAAFTPGVGNLLVVTVQMWANVGTPAVVVSDNVNAGNYTQAFIRITSGDPKAAVLQFYKNNVLGASTTVTVNPVPATAWFIATITELTGQDTSTSVLDPATTNGIQTSATSVSLTTSPPAFASNAAIGILTWTIGTRVVAPNTGFTEITEIENGGSGGVNYVSIVRNITTSAIAITMGWSVNATTDGNMAIGVYRASSGVIITPPAPVIAFPSAEGYGINTVGGRGGHAYLINSLASGTGSGGSCNAGGCGGSAPFTTGTITLGDCIKDRFGMGARTCIFRVGGLMDVSPPCETCYQSGSGFSQVIAPPNLTIAGQTAPGDGVMLKGIELAFWNTHDIIVRHIRIRPGDVDFGTATSFGALDVYNSQNVIMDHVSTGWIDDDTLWADGCVNCTWQWSLWSEGKACNSCTDGSISKVGGVAYYGRDVSATGASFLHNYWANYQWRIPVVNGGQVQIVNNVTYNVQTAVWTNPCYNNSPQSLINLVGNYMQNGPAGASDVLNRSPALQITGAGWSGANCRGLQSYFYVSGTWHSGVCTSMADACQHTFIFGQPGDTSLPSNYTWATTPFPWPTIPTQTDALTAKTQVLAKAGAYAVAGGIATVRRDSIDTRSINDLINLTGTATRSNWSDISQVGGWPTYANGTPYTDTDGDGISDAWETAHGLDPNNAADGPAYAANGYTNLENFINELAGDTIPSAPSGSAIQSITIFNSRKPN